MSTLPRLVTLLSVAAAWACVDDVVLPNHVISPVCGNGVREEGEACDVSSPGCVACAVVPNWTCSEAGCSIVCGDGVVGDGPDCAGARRAEPCDMTGYWAVRETNYARDAVVGSVQTSSNWFFYRVTQTGDAFEITENLDCGVYVTGSVTVESTPGTLRASMYANRMDGGGARRARRGISRPSADGCEVSLERWYKVRGVTDDHLPTDFDARPELGTLLPMPKVDDPVAGDVSPPGAIDPDGDGIVGTSFRITGFVTGVRNSAQRDWKEFQTAAGLPAPRGALVFTVPGAFELEESVLRVTECGSACALMASPARAATDLPGKITFSFVGRARGSARVDAVVAGTPRADLDDDLATCANVRAVLPHEGGAP